MAIITNMREYTFLDEYEGYVPGKDIEFYCPLTADKGFAVLGVLTKILVRRQDGTDVYFRVRDASNIEADYCFNEIVLPEDVERLPFEVKVFRITALAQIPTYATAGSSGFDLKALYGIELPSRRPTYVPTGLAFEIPAGFEMQVRGRSSLGMKGITIANGVGTIDCDYRGEVGVVLMNLCGVPYWIQAGDRIAQGVIVPVMQAVLVEANELSGTVRGENGFGSTGR